MIELINVWKKHPGSKDWVLRDVNITIPDKTNVALIGSNGQGKSTLLHMLGALSKPTRGEIKKDCSISWPIGLDGGFKRTLTGRQNVHFVSRIYGYADSIDEIDKEILAFTELGEAYDRPVQTYSSGMRAKLGFGLSLSLKFDVYLSDEATSVGDIRFREKASKAFKERMSEASLIIVSHSERIIRDTCESGIYVKNGQAFWFDDVTEALEIYHNDLSNFEGV